MGEHPREVTLELSCVQVELRWGVGSVYWQDRGLLGERPDNGVWAMTPREARQWAMKLLEFADKAQFSQNNQEEQ